MSAKPVLGKSLIDIYIYREREGLGQYLEVLLTGHLQRVIMYPLVPLGNLLYSASLEGLYPTQGLIAYSLVL